MTEIPKTPEHLTGRWEYVASNEHHGPYVVSEFGSTICDCYTMSDPSSPSVRNGGTSKPINFMADYADSHARLIAEAPALLEALFRLKTEAEIDGLDKRPGWDAWVSLANEVIARATSSEPSA